MKPKRIISLLVAVCMMVAMLPVSAVTAFAADPVLLKSGDTITNGGAYYMSGEYAEGITVNTNDDVTINIKADVTGGESSHYAISVTKVKTLTINNPNNCAFTGWKAFTRLDQGKMVVNGGIYYGKDAGAVYDDLATFYNNGADAEMTLNDVTVISDQRAAVGNVCGHLYINGGKYIGKNLGTGFGVIYNQSSRKVTAVMKLRNATLDSDGWGVMNNGELTIDADNDKDSRYESSLGVVFTRDPGTTTIKNGTFSTKENSWTLDEEDGIQNYALGVFGTLNFEGGTVTAPNGSAIAGEGETAYIKVTGGTIENSKYGIELKESNMTGSILGTDAIVNTDVTLENVNFQNNTTDIYLGDEQYITIDSNFEGNPTIGCKDAKENRRLTTVSADQKNIRLTSVDDNYIVALYKNDDGTEYQELVKRIGHFVTAKNAVATAEISGEVKTLDDTVQVPENTEVTVKADKAPEGMVFEKWEVSPADVITDETFDLTAETATFKMPGKDVTVTAKYVTPEAPKYDLTVKDGTVKVNGKDAVANANGVYEVAENEEVTVTFDKTTLSDAQVFDQWSIKPDSVLNAVDPKAEIITFKMPAEKVTIEAMTKDATIEDDGPDILGTAAMIGVGVAGTAVLGYQGYMLGTELYLKGALPAWAVIPQNRAELALLLWKDAEQPEPVENVLYEDIDENDTDIQKAACWAVENDLMELLDEDNNPDHFDPAAPVTRLEVIRTWNHAQELKG